MKKGLILTNAYSALPTALRQSVRLREELAALGVATDVRRNDFFPFTIGGDGGIESSLEPYDFCVYLDKDKYVSYLLEKTGMRLFNRHESIRICDDKAETHALLAGCGVPMPATLPGLLCYNPEMPVKDEVLDFVEKRLGYPVIAKACYGSLGREVFKADNRAELARIAERLKCQPHLFQQYVAESAGQDFRVIVIGGRAVAAMKRVAQNDFRSNLELGGRGEPCDADGEMRALCEKVAALLRLDYCGIDLLRGKDSYLVCEVNSNAFFGGIERVTGVNVAKVYAEHIYGEIYRD